MNDIFHCCSEVFLVAIFPVMLVRKGNGRKKVQSPSLRPHRILYTKMPVWTSLGKYSGEESYCGGYYPNYYTPFASLASWNAFPFARPSGQIFYHADRAGSGRIDLSLLKSQHTTLGQFCSSDNSANPLKLTSFYSCRPHRLFQRNVGHAVLNRASNTVQEGRNPITLRASLAEAEIEAALIEAWWYSFWTTRFRHLASDIW